MTEHQIKLHLNQYKNINKLIVKKYHIVNADNKIIKHKICNIFAPFGREADFNKFNSIQQRFNIGFSQDDIKHENKSYKQFTEIINLYESYFKEFDELKDYELVSNIINRDSYGIIIRCHLKTLKNNTMSKLFLLSEENNLEENNSLKLSEWIQFDKTNQFNMEYTFDCLWIDDENKKFGISIQVLSVFQLIR